MRNPEPPVADGRDRSAALRFDAPPSRTLSWLGDRTSEVLKRIYRIRVDAAGFEPSKFADGPTIVAANHVSLLDTVALRYVLPPAVRRRTATVGARDFFVPAETDRGLRRLLRTVSCAYVEGTYRVCLIGRGDDMGDGVARIAGLLAEGWHVILFPEGTRSRSGAMGRFRMGVAHVARTSGVPVLPVHLAGTDRVMPVGARRLHAGSIRARAGMPLRIGADEGNQAFLARMRAAIEDAGRG